MKILSVPYKNARYKIDVVLDIKLSDKHYEELKNRKINVVCNPYGNRPRYYFKWYENGSYYLLHRYIAKAKGKTDMVDHIDRDTLNNLPNNLRIVTAAQNAWNSAKKRPHTKYKGVYRNGNDGYSALIARAGITYRAGVFETAEEARDAHNELERMLYGKYASAQ